MQQRREHIVGAGLQAFAADQHLVHICAVVAAGDVPALRDEVAQHERAAVPPGALPTMIAAAGSCGWR